MLRARDAMDRAFAEQLDVAAVASVAHVSPAHFSRQFRAMFVKTDADLGNMGWLTVALPDDPELELALMAPGPPIHDDATVEQLRELIAKGAGSGVIFQTEDCRGAYERLKAEGVEVTQEP